MRIRRFVTGTALALPLVALAAGPSSAAAFGADWEFSESGGNVIHDSSGNGNDGVLGVGQRLGGGVLTSTGRDNSTIPSSASLNPGTADFYWSASVRRTGGYENPNIVQKGRYGDPAQWKMDYWHGWAFCKVIVKDRQRSVRLNVNLADGHYHIITCKKQGTSLKINIDGRHNSVSNAPTAAISNSKPVSIAGKEPCPLGNCDRLTGYIDWIRVGLL